MHGARFIPTPVGNAIDWRTISAPMSVHPHARGERACSPAIIRRCSGSSPRPWGTLRHHPDHQPEKRFIPTPVGKARQRASARCAPTVHPHARGERVGQGVRVAGGCGSSPRPWGTPCQDEPQDARCRFIPTPVGNAWRRARRSAPAPVHPHARGERCSVMTEPCARVGSSPRPWGTLRGKDLRDRGGRFIPTPVGNASCPSRRHGWSTVHPHARGERVTFFE